MKALGVDVGGTGIKAAPVDLSTGSFLREKSRIETPFLCTPEVLASTVKDFCKKFDWAGPVGIGFPGVIRHGCVQTAANLDHSWIGVPIEEFLSAKLSLPVSAINDADAAGLAEFQFGGGHKHTGLILFLTIGTGIGSALFYQGRLIPNTELGHLPLHQATAEKYASRRTKKKENLSWPEWGLRLNKYLSILERTLTPDLIILGGGASKKFSKYVNSLKLQTPVKPAELLNRGGILGAALGVAEHPSSEVALTSPS